MWVDAAHQGVTRPVCCWLRSPAMFTLSLRRTALRCHSRPNPCGHGAWHLPGCHGQSLPHGFLPATLVQADRDVPLRATAGLRDLCNLASPQQLQSPYQLSKAPMEVFVADRDRQPKGEGLLPDSMPHAQVTVRLQRQKVEVAGQVATGRS